MKKSFLDFERWWGGYHFLNEAEIHWIVEQLFIGNRLSRGEAILEHGRRLDLKAIRSPIIVFASWGDNITPPQQALNWIVDTYVDEHEIRIRGQRIIYMVHEKVGHLGIFVSSSIAKKEHAEVASTLKTIEALPPGLYEMTIDEADRRRPARALQRQLPRAQALRHSRHRRERPQRRARFSRHRAALRARLGDLRLDGAAVRAGGWSTTESAAAMRAAHPSRVAAQNVRRRQSADETGGRSGRARAKPSESPPRVEPMAGLGKMVGGRRSSKPSICGATRATPPARRRSLRLWGSPFMHRIGATHAFERTRKDRKELRFLPEVQAILRAPRSRRLRRGGDPHAHPARRLASGRCAAIGSNDRRMCSPRTSRSSRSAPSAARQSSASNPSSSNSSPKRRSRPCPALARPGGARKSDRRRRVHRRRDRRDGARTPSRRCNICAPRSTCRPSPCPTRLAIRSKKARRAPRERQSALGRIQPLHFRLELEAQLGGHWPPLPPAGEGWGEGWPQAQRIENSPSSGPPGRRARGSRHPRVRPGGRLFSRRREKGF